MVFKENEGGIIISKDCVDIISTSADPTRNFYRVRFRNPKLFVGGKYSTPQWGQKAAMTIGTKYYGVKGCKITMAQPVGGRWMIQSVLIPKDGGVEMNEELALKIANHIQDRIEREGQWTAVMCRDNETKRYISKINGQHIERDERGRFAPHAAEEFGAEGEIFNREDVLRNATVVGTFEVIDGIIPSLNLRDRWEDDNRLQDGTWTLYRITYPSEGYFLGDDRPVMYYALYDNPETLHRQGDWFDDTWYDFQSFDFQTQIVSLCNITFRVEGETQFNTKIQYGDTGHPKIIALRIIKSPPILFNGWFDSDYSMDSFNYRLEYGFSGGGVMTADWPQKIGDVKNKKIGENILIKFKEDIELRGGESRLQTYTRSWDGRDIQPTVIATLFVDFPHFPQYRINLVRWPVLMGVKTQDGLEAEEFGAESFGAEEEYINPYGGPNDPDYLKKEWIDKVYYNIDSGRWIPLPSGYKRGCSPHNFMYNRMENRNTYADEILPPHDNFNVIFRCIMCGMEVDRQVRFSDNYFAGISPITAPHRAEEFGADSTWRVNTCTHRYEDTEEEAFSDYSAWKLRDSEVCMGDGSSGYVETGVRCDICGQERIGSWAIENVNEGFQITKGEEGRMPRNYGWTSVNELFGAESKLTKEEIIEYLLSNSADYLNDGLYYKVNEDTWTLSDLFIRQYLNNLVDGFGMVNVMEVYQYLCKHKDLLIEYNMVSKDGWNNSGLTLWENYNFDDYLERFGAEEFGAEGDKALYFYDKEAEKMYGYGYEMAIPKYIVISDQSTFDEPQWMAQITDSPTAELAGLGEGSILDMEEGWYAKSEYSSKELIEYLENKYPTLEIIGPASRLGDRAEEFEAYSGGISWRDSCKHGTINQMGGVNYCEKQFEGKCEHCGNRFCKIHLTDENTSCFSCSKSMNAESFGAETFEAQQFYENCSDNQFEIFGRKLYYKCRNVGSVMNQKVSDFGDGGLGSYKGGQYALRLAGGMNKYDIMNTLAEVSNDMKPNTMADWRGVVSATNQIISVKNAEEWGAEAFEAFDFLTYCEPCENYTTHYFREEFCDVCNNKYNNEELHSEGLEAQRGVKG